MPQPPTPEMELRLFKVRRLHNEEEKIEWWAGRSNGLMLGRGRTVYEALGLWAHSLSPYISSEIPGAELSVAEKALLMAIFHRQPYLRPALAGQDISRLGRIVFNQLHERGWQLVVEEVERASGTARKLTGIELS